MLRERIAEYLGIINNYEEVSESYIRSADAILSIIREALEELKKEKKYDVFDYCIQEVMELLK